MTTDEDRPWLAPLAGWTARLDGGALAARTRERVAFSLIDWAGAAIAGGRHRLAAPYRAAMEAGAGGNGPEARAMTAAALSHLDEIDDGHRAAMMHPGITVWPVVLALAADRPLSLGDVAAAVTAGYEAGVRVGALLGPEHYGVHHTTATAGSFGAAAAAARAMGLGEAATLSAFGHAGTQAAGLWQFAEEGLSDAKAFHAATAARNGLTAAHLARAGIPGARHILEGKKGALRAWWLDRTARSLAPLPQGLAVETATIKAWPVCGQMHPTLDAVAALARDGALMADDIAEIAVETYAAQVEIADRRAPQTVEEAKFSTAFCVAALIVAGGLDIATLTPALLAREDIAALAGRIRLVEVDAFTRAFPNERPTRIAVRFRDGSTREHERRFRKGDPEDPWTWDELVARFHATAAHLREHRRRDLVGWARALADGSADAPFDPAPVLRAYEAQPEPE
ncbi:MmgE/PrpD family protein [Kaustia mangrovi]|uniref:MmgE/PrpD family protein n=1 Tax=Kaustia mangrovi TaxID=2593653 RepID=A0A7S8C5L1_9HYPH|nr:MmgE/PrpD family protein [Kaustia mangrovi]QPC43777.1 MmgE/PrpD family protein [Kaustia mangrovi]